MIKSFIFKYYIYISIFIICSLSVALSFQAYKNTLKERRIEKLMLDKDSMVATLKDANFKQKLIIQNLELSYKELDQKREKNYEQEIKNFKDNYSVSIFTVNSLHQTITELQYRAEDLDTSREEVNRLLSSYERVSKECSSEFVTLANDAEKLKIELINSDQDNDNLRYIINLNNKLNTQD